ncbi:MAG: heptosyltransferase-1 [Cryomorphaceae bacterium]
MSEQAYAGENYRFERITLMRVLVVKLTSMGDVLHLMPALSDLRAAHPLATVDWMVEDSFAELPHWHPSVDKVIKVSTRHWRKFDRRNVGEFFAFLTDLRRQRYDYIIDAQGLMKSAVFARFAKLNKGGTRVGFSGDSIKEAPAAYLYQKKISALRSLHAIDRLRILFSAGFDYTANSQKVDYGLQINAVGGKNRRTIFLLHGTTWASKHLPDQIWRDLTQLITKDGYHVKLCWGNQQERQRAQWIAQASNQVTILPKLSLSELAVELATAKGSIAVDTGLGHMAAALSVPTVSIYGSTNAKLTGTVGLNQIQLQSDYHCSPCLLKKCDKLNDKIDQPPCYAAISPDTIWKKLCDQFVESTDKLGV